MGWDLRHFSGRHPTKIQFAGEKCCRAYSRHGLLFWARGGKGLKHCWLHTTLKAPLGSACPGASSTLPWHCFSPSKLPTPWTGSRPNVGLRAISPSFREATAGPDSSFLPLCPYSHGPAQLCWPSHCCSAQWSLYLKRSTWPWASHIAMMLPWLDLTTICRPVRFHMDSQVFPACQRETLLLPLCDIQSHNCLWVFQIPIAFFFHKNRSTNSWVIVRLQPKRLYSCSQNFHCFHLDKTVFFS